VAVRGGREGTKAVGYERERESRERERKRGKKRNRQKEREREREREEARGLDEKKLAGKTGTNILPTCGIPSENDATPTLLPATSSTALLLGASVAPQTTGPIGCPFGACARAAMGAAAACLGRIVSDEHGCAGCLKEGWVS
jgi:hypothetical protein